MLSDGNYAVPASTTISSFSVTVGSTIYSINPVDLNLGYTDETEKYIMLAVTAADITDQADNALFIVSSLRRENSRPDST
jgi:hypothetical protein